MTSTMTTRTAAAAAAAAAINNPPPASLWWCNVCDMDCRSAVSMSCHVLGTRHRRKANLPILTYAQQRAILIEQGILRNEEARLLGLPVTTTTTRTLPLRFYASAPKSTSATTTTHLPAVAAAPATAPVTAAATPAAVQPLPVEARRAAGLAVEDVPVHVAYSKLFNQDIDEFGCLVEEKDADHQAEGIFFDDPKLHDVDLKRLDDKERMQQQEFEDAVVEVALFNYAQYHEVDIEKVTFAQVATTSAGVQGWAACVLQSENNTSASTPEDDPLTHWQQPVKGDDQEAQELQKALLESIGTRVATVDVVSHAQTLASLYTYRRQESDSEEDEKGDQDSDEETTYEYEDDEDGYSDDENDDEHDGDDSESDNHDEDRDGNDGDEDKEEEEEQVESSSLLEEDSTSNSAWSIVSHTSSSYAMLEAADFASSEDSVTEDGGN